MCPVQTTVIAVARAKLHVTVKDKIHFDARNRTAAHESQYWLWFQEGFYLGGENLNIDSDS